MNYVNAIDGRGKTATMPLKRIELEPSISVNPKRGIPGDSINVQLHDFQTGDMVTRIEFARTVDICDDKADTYHCMRRPVSPIWSDRERGRQRDPEF